MMSKKVIAALATATTLTTFADVKPARLFTNNMVIQRETKAPIWGWAEAGEKVTVTGSWGNSAETTTNSKGKWMVKLQTPSAGGPHTLTFKGNNIVERTNVLSGDVWLCSGQSNMQWTVGQAAKPDEEAKNADYPNIRHFTVERYATQTLSDDCKGKWKICSADTVKGFSATAYFTGRELHKNLNIPIGLITSAWGGTCIEAWTKLSEQTDDPFSEKRKEKFDTLAKNYTPENAKANYQKDLEAWKVKVERAKAKKRKGPRRPRLQRDPLNNQNYPSSLYNGMINPLLGYAIKGAVWYQGESNAVSIENAEYYRVQLDRMVRTWRTAWGQDFPFYPVQLPNFKSPQAKPIEKKHRWPVVRESIAYMAQNTPNCGTAAMIDIGEEKNIHPSNKQDVGYRMASTILNKTYGQSTPTTPFMKSFSIEGGNVVISFDYTGSGLVAKGGALKTFAIAGADKKFVWADAKIETRTADSSTQNGLIFRKGVQTEDVVVVSSDKVKEPLAVRYAWADNPAECNLYSKEGFPASPFRTDSWKISAR